MKITKRGVLSVLVVLAFTGMVFFFAGRQAAETGKKQEFHQKNLFAMDTFFSLKVYGAEAEEGLEACETKIKELEHCFSVTDPESELATVNRMSGGQVSYDTYTCVEKALEIGTKTDGALDITLYPVLRAWGFTTGEYHVPEESEITELMQYVNAAGVRTTENAAAAEANVDAAGTGRTEDATAAEANANASGAGTTVNDGQYGLVLEEGMELDLGAIAKGYTGDCLMEILKQYGVSGGLLDLGGNIQFFGTKPDQTAWKIAVKDPFDGSRQIGILELRGEGAVVTSGNYERYFVDDAGVRYGHILDPETGRPVESDLASVTIVGGTGTESDGLSTALFVKGKEGAIRFWRENRNFGMILVGQDGCVLVTENLAPGFELNRDSGEIPQMEILYGA